MILNFDEYGEDDDDDHYYYHDDIDEGKDVVHKREYVVKERTLIGFIKKNTGSLSKDDDDDKDDNGEDGDEK